MFPFVKTNHARTNVRKCARMIGASWRITAVRSVRRNSLSASLLEKLIPWLAAYGTTKKSGTATIKTTLSNQAPIATHEFHGGSLGVGT